MKLVLVALNAQYMHTNLAVRQLAAYMEAEGAPAAEIVEFTINHRVDEVLEALVALRAEVYIFSCYIWNAEMVAALGVEMKKLLPGVCLGAGGPQAGADGERFLNENSAFDAVICGEGEVVLCQWAGMLSRKEPAARWAQCPGLVWRHENGLVANKAAPPPDMDRLPFAYGDLQPLAGRILYYESMRGCPFRCSYCLSGSQPGVRYKSVDKVKKELSIFLKAGVRQVKFVDRSFNCDAPRALALWRFLAEKDNGITNFHFELAGHLLDDESIEFLAGVRPGLFQFEIGVQSTNEVTLKEIERPGSQQRLFQRVARLREPGNVHLHLDLIAGLPFEGYASFARSFNEVYAQRPHQLQLGFLKVLIGSKMESRAAGYGLVWRSGAPFEVLYTRWIDYPGLCRLKLVEEMVELYYNSGRFSHLVGYLCAKSPTPFEFFQALGDFYRQAGYGYIMVGKKGQYELLGSFAKAQGWLVDERMQWLCRYDLALHEKPRSLPDWVRVDGSRPYRKQVLAFYEQAENVERHLPHLAGRETGQLLRMAHIEVFPFNPETGEEGQYPLLFNYDLRDVTGKARACPITLPKA